MRNHKALTRGILALAILGLTTAAFVVSPVGAATTVTKKKAKTIATNKVNQLTPGIATGIANSLASRVAYGTTLLPGTGAVTTDNGTISTAQITAPGPGFLAIDAGGRFANETTNDRFLCVIRVDGTNITESYKTETHNGADNISEDDDCNTQAAVPVNTGQHTVDFRFEDADVGDLRCCSSAYLWVIWAPFDGAGNRPTSFVLARLGGSEAASGGS